MSVNKTKEQTEKQKQKTPRTFDDLGGPAKTVAEKKTFSSFF